MTGGPSLTHDPSLRSWVESANVQGCDFPIQNLPFGAFRRRAGEPYRLGTAIGDRVLDLCGVAAARLTPGLDATVLQALQAERLNPLLALGPAAWGAARAAISALLQAGDDGARPDPALLPRVAEVELGLPVTSENYTDFYASLHHATNVGRLFRPEQPLLPNYKYVPIAYHGRASSLAPSGALVRRPSGQLPRSSESQPGFGPCRQLDYEAEVGFYVGPGNVQGEPIPIGAAGDQIFGFCLLNDWSARDIQRWEYQPLGPFLAKSFATTVSPWVVTAEALAPFRAPAAPRQTNDPPPLPYLSDPADAFHGALDLRLEVFLQTAAMRANLVDPVRLSRSNTRELYWTPAQMVAHHTSNGCNLRPGDLLATGTVSGRADEARGCLLELTRGGAAPIALPTGEQRAFLEDGDEVIITGRCVRSGFVPLGFGACRGRVIS